MQGDKEDRRRSDERRHVEETLRMGVSVMCSIRSSLTSQIETNINLEEPLNSLTAGATPSLYPPFAGDGEQTKVLANGRSHISSSATATSTIPSPRWISLHEACHGKIAAHFYRRLESSSQPSPRTLPSQLPRVSTMEAELQRPKGREKTISALSVAIETLNLAKELSSITPAKAVFGSVSVILVTIRVSPLLSLC